MWIGIDDTDSTRGGCTTYVARTIIQRIAEKYNIIGYPRLVRLNPNIPWKTRGNGALCIRVGKYNGKIKQKIGEINNQEIFCSHVCNKDLDKNDNKYIAKLIKEIIQTEAYIDDENTNPGYVLMEKKPNIDLYKKAVTTIVSIDIVKELLLNQKAIFEAYKNGRGLIGATAAISWESIDRTFELIAYRSKERWGSKRQVDFNSVQEIDKNFLTTFDNLDVKNHHNRIAPNSPCPILYGIRGNNAEELIAASAHVKSEPIESWLLFETNQGTDDHLQKKQISEIKPFESVIAEGSVIMKPSTIQGGHVLFQIQDKTGVISCAAYEPTKEFRNTVRELNVGDYVEVYGGVREYPLTINLEKLDVKHLAIIKAKVENPICPTCNKHMKSKGLKKGYKCVRCGKTSITQKFQEQKRSIKKGFYEVPVCARRHLSKPLRRMNPEFEYAKV